MSRLPGKCRLKLRIRSTENLMPKYSQCTQIERNNITRFFGQERQNAFSVSFYIFISSTTALAACLRLIIISAQLQICTHRLRKTIVRFSFCVRWLITCLQNHVIFYNLWPHLSWFSPKHLWKATLLQMMHWTHVQFQSSVSYVVTTNDHIKSDRGSIHTGCNKR